MTAHVDSGEPLPRSLFDKMMAAKNFQSGMQTLRQIEFSLFDMLLHTTWQPGDDVMALLGGVRKDYAVITPPSYSRTAHTFSHIFSGGYAAGYYSYKWAEVLSADAYAAFEESAQTDMATGINTDAEAGPGPVSLETGRKYREAILEAGGSRPAMESFKAFRGREPSIDALLRHQGMA
jgi:oligopeptidase A